MLNQASNQKATKRSLKYTSEARCCKEEPASPQVGSSGSDRAPHKPVSIILDVDDSDSLPCIHNGRRVRLPEADVHRLLFSSDIGVVLPLNYIRTQWQKNGEFFPVPRSYIAGLEFGLPLLDRKRGAPLGILELGEILEMHDMTPSTFHGRARTWARLLGTEGPNRPFEFCDMLESRISRVRSYRMKSDSTWLVVLDTSEGINLNRLADLLEPPVDNTDEMCVTT